jgi:uncharacterized protein (TIGR00369 family)
MEKNRFETLKTIFIEKIPANKIFGIQIIELKRGHVKLHVPFKEEFVGDFKQGLWHGGILASIADTAGGLAGASTLSFPDDKINTIDMRVDYLNGAIKKDIYVEADLIKIGNRVIKADVKIYQEDSQEPVALARCAYSILRKKIF